jgi:hypothetical protein
MAPRFGFSASLITAGLFGGSQYLLQDETSLTCWERTLSQNDDPIGGALDVSPTLIWHSSQKPAQALENTQCMFS